MQDTLLGNNDQPAFALGGTKKIEAKNIMPRTQKSKINVKNGI